MISNFAKFFHTNTPGSTIEEGEINYESLHTDSNLDSNLKWVKGAKSNGTSALQISTTAVKANGGFDVTGITTLAGKLLLSGTEDLADSGAAALDKTVSYFTTGGTETATLAAGAEGQLKVFYMVGHGGNMTITVTNSGWGDANEAIFKAVGDCAVLMYFNSKWNAISTMGTTELT